MASAEIALPPIHVHIHITDGEDLTVKLDQILEGVQDLQSKGTQLMADLTALTSEVQEAAGVQASAVALLTSLAQQIRDLSTDPAALQALADQLDASTTALADAVAANSTPAP